MIKIDWRTPAAYGHAKTLPAAGFAWEYLRRNDEYHRDFQRLARTGRSDESELENFVRRWGLRFPARSRDIAKARSAVLVTPVSAAGRQTGTDRTGRGDPPASRRSRPSRRPRTAPRRRWLAWYLADGWRRTSVLATRILA
uniref:transcriptional regulator domain-containing protein n=1 Tax=unclassified Martelella TaxID=2629616 RepID=UPI001FF07925|nr:MULTISPECIES: DUF6499 domain-containing protein [unclassified Martelella]